MARKKIRKPRETNGNGCYPKVELDEANKIWLQSTPKGTWKRLSPGKASAFSDRLNRMVKYVRKNKRCAA